MSVEENKTAARAYFEKLLNAGELSILDSLFLRGVRFHYPLGELEGIEAVRQYLAAVRTAFEETTDVRHLRLALPSG